MNETIVVVVCAILGFNLLKPVIDIFYTYGIARYLFSKRKQLRNAGEWAIVTGSTSGIGEAFAYELAADGLNVFLLSRSEDKLKTLADRLEQQYHIRTKYLAVDFTQPDIYDKIEQELSTLSTIACLVNNVGMTNKAVEEIASEPSLTCERIREVINCNITSTACMTRLVLPQLVQQNSGAAIINMSSASAWLALGYHTMYAASKAWIAHFSNCLHEEVSNHRILIQNYSPLYIATKMFQKKQKLHIPDARTFVKCALNMIGVKHDLAGYWIHELEFLLYRISPQLGITCSTRKEYLRSVAKDK